jgi:hypothetical protein
MNELEKEMRELENEKELQKKILDAEKVKIKNMLIQGMGQDMKDVLQGKVKVKLSFKEKVRYKWRSFWNKIDFILNMF